MKSLRIGSLFISQTILIGCLFLSKSEGISVIDYRKDEGYITPVEIAGEDKVYISRIRNDESIDNGINLWVVSDNLRKGAALNAVQISELIIKSYSEYLK